MEAMYHIENLCPRTDINMGRCGFCVRLYPGFKAAVAKSGLDQQKVNTVIHDMHRVWLDGCGYVMMYDPDADPRAEWEEKHTGKKAKLGPRAHKLYGEHEIRVSWGEWGPEHITVPGDACGLDIGGGLKPPGGECLCPHNVDNLSQVVLLLCVFTEFAGYVIMETESKEWKKKTS